jgi:hypothetical protein
MALPLAAAVAVPARRLAPALLPALLALFGLFLLVIIGVVGAMFGIQPVQGGYAPSASARAEIPVPYLRLYQDAGRHYGVDPWVLAAIGSIETDHGRSPAPGVRSGVNAYGCCAGPMQFSLVGSASTWDRYGVDGNGDGRRSPTTRPMRSRPPRGTYVRPAHRTTTAPRCSRTTMPTGTSPRCSPRPPPTAERPGQVVRCQSTRRRWASCSATDAFC